MELPTYTNIWKIEKRLYKLYDFRLPMPLPVGQLAVFVAIAVPYMLILTIAGMPFSHTWVWLYVLPPGVLAWLVTRPVLESKRLPELVLSQLRYLSEPRTWCRMAPLAEKDEITVVARVWRRPTVAAAFAVEYKLWTCRRERAATAKAGRLAAGESRPGPQRPRRLRLSQSRPKMETTFKRARSGPVVRPSTRLLPALCLPPPRACRCARCGMRRFSAPGVTGPAAAAPAVAAPPRPAKRPQPQCRTATRPQPAPAVSAPPAAAVTEPPSPCRQVPSGRAARPCRASGRAVPSSRPGARPGLSVRTDGRTAQPLHLVERALRSSAGGGPASGWHDRVVVVPGGHRPGKPDQVQRDQARARLPLAGPARVVVLGCTAGAGQTVTTLLTGSPAGRPARRGRGRARPQCRARLADRAGAADPALAAGQANRRRESGPRARAGNGACRW